jgi:hypothetical protein
VRANLVKVCAVLLGLVVCAAAQDLSPTFLGAKPPFLLVFGCFAGIPAAVGAGLFTDALGGLPFGCSAVFYALSALLARLLRNMAIAVVFLAATVYQLWVALWSEGGDTLHTFSGAAIAAAVLSPLASAAIRLVRRRIGLNAQEGSR